MFAAEIGDYKAKAQVLYSEEGCTEKNAKGVRGVWVVDCIRWDSALETVTTIRRRIGREGTPAYYGPVWDTDDIDLLRRDATIPGAVREAIATADLTAASCKERMSAKGMGESI